MDPLRRSRCLSLSRERTSDTGTNCSSAVVAVRAVGSKNFSRAHTPFSDPKGLTMHNPSTSVTGESYSLTSLRFRVDVAFIRRQLHCRSRTHISAAPRSWVKLVPLQTFELHVFTDCPNTCSPCSGLICRIRGGIHISFVRSACC